MKTQFTHSLRYARLLGLLLWVLCPALVAAQLPRSSAFKQNYSLQEVVILSRHNIRAPLSTRGSLLERLTSHPWTQWTAHAGELTLRGGICETMLGQYFRQWLVGEGMFPENHVPSADEVSFYANSMQRTIATAQYFSSGFLPVANLTIHHRYSPSKMDPLFFPGFTRMDAQLEESSARQIAQLAGKEGLASLPKKLEGAFQLLEEVLDLKHSPACRQDGFQTFALNDNQLKLKAHEEPGINGSLKTATTVSDALVLQYYEEADERKAAFGHHLSFEQWKQLSSIKDTFIDLLFTAPAVACHIAHPMLQYLYDELNARHRRFTFLCGHDSNIASVLGALRVKPYELPRTIERHVPIGSKLVFEKWTDKEGKDYVALQLVYPASDQLRHLDVLTEQNPPMMVPLFLEGLTPTADGLYPYEEMAQRFEQVLRAF